MRKSKALKIGIGMCLVALFIATTIAVLLISSLREDDCFVTSLPVKLSEEKYQKNTYGLYMVIAGFHEKSGSLRLYEEPVTANLCGELDAAPLTTLSLDDSVGIRGVSSVRILSLDRIDATFDNKQIQYENISVEWRLSK